MENQKSELSHQTQIGNIPPKFQEKFLIKRIDEEDIEITLDQRNGILQALNAGDRFVQIGKYTLMLNGIKSIDPKWGARNIPPKPDYHYGGMTAPQAISSMGTADNQEEIEEWEKLFGKHF